MAKTVKRIDITRWERKVQAIIKAMPDLIDAEVKWGAEKVNAKTIINLTGPFYGFRKGPRGGRYPIKGARTNDGQLPIPRITGNLRRSITMREAGRFLMVVFADDHIANYAKYVNDGTKYMKARRFLMEAVTSTQAIIIQRWDKMLHEVWRNMGR